MQKLWTSDDLTIQEIIDQVDNGELAVPKFQRPFVWSTPAQKALIETVLRNLPSGALLFLAVDPKDIAFAPQALNGAPPLSKKSPPEQLILDGQQRVTTIYRAFSANAAPRFFIDLHALLTAGQLSEEQIIVKRSSSQGVAAQAAKGIVALDLLIRPHLMAGWYRSYADHFCAGDHDQIEGLMERVGELLPGVGSSAHKLPVIQLKKGSPLQAVVNVFEGINRRGTRLNGFDLMVARLYRDQGGGKHFDLREAWEIEATKYPSLARLGIDVDRHGLLPLQVIALAVSRLPEESRPPGVRGVSQADILELPQEQVIGGTNVPVPGLSLSEAFKALATAADFVFKHCGVLEGHMLPQASMLVPLADQFRMKPDERLSDLQLKKWFFASGLMNRYYGSVNSYVQTDGKQLRAWADSPTAVPDAIQKLTKAHVEGLQLQQPATREGALLARTLMAMLVAQGAKDWREGQFALAALDEPVQIHHAIPAEILKRVVGAQAANPIAVLTPLSQLRNASLRDKSPSDVFQQLKGDAKPILESHCFDPSLFASFKQSDSKIRAVLAERERRLKAFIVSTMGL